MYFTNPQRGFFMDIKDIVLDFRFIKESLFRAHKQTEDSISEVFFVLEQNG